MRLNHFTHSSHTMLVASTPSAPRRTGAKERGPSEHRSTEKNHQSAVVERLHGPCGKQVKQTKKLPSCLPHCATQRCQP
jgi:hypothetical protein